ncbi:hypothetical protein B0O99DRAFT_655118 [Bisporella sp. PMI_857]|nr:hypothetical protein B0O99DRAFT_655118 [Bisporella sp. PMI_857]
MEEITGEVSKIENGLHSSRYQLQTLETSAKGSISSEVDGLRSSLKNGDSRAEYVTDQMRSFFSQIQYINDVSTVVDIKPQMLWLHENLQVIVSDLDAAKAKADSSIKCTEKYSYEVMDVGEEVTSNSNKLTEYHDKVAKLEEQAKSSLSSSEIMLEYTQSQIERKEREIKEKMAEAVSKRRRKTQLETDLENKRQQVAHSERERKDRKEQAIVGVGLGVFGIIAAPFTGGASLALTVGGGGLAGYKANRMDDFQNEANSYRQSINSLITEISQNVQAVASLEREKTRLQSLVSQYQSEVSKRKSEHQVYQVKIEQADRVKGEITILRSHATSTKKNVTQALPELHKIKQNLEQCSTLVKERSLDVSTSSGLMDRFLPILPVIGVSIKRYQDFNKQKLLMQQALETLDQIHTEVPKLLPSTGDVKFLDIKPWNSEIVSVIDVGAPIPDVCYY